MSQLKASFGIVLGGLVAASALIGGCSSSGDNNATTSAAGSGGSGGSTGGTSGAGGAGGATACTTGVLLIFTPAYSAYDGVNTYKVPVIAVGVTDEVKWTASPADAVDFDPDAVQFGDGGTPPGRGAMITTRKAGTVTITATSGTSCGQTTLTIDQATADLQQIGKDRYNNGVPISFDGGRTPACTNCHGAMSSTMFDIIHTPQQTGGYSDDDLINIFTKGQKPAGVGCRVITSCAVWSSFHKWDVTEEEQKGVVYYLRSLEPAPQGASDFGGGRPPPMRDAGGGMPEAAPALAH